MTLAFGVCTQLISARFAVLLIFLLGACSASKRCYLKMSPDIRLFCVLASKRVVIRVFWQDLSSLRSPLCVPQKNLETYSITENMAFLEDNHQRIPCSRLPGFCGTSLMCNAPIVFQRQSLGCFSFVVVSLCFASIHWPSSWAYTLGSLASLWQPLRQICVASNHMSLEVNPQRFMRICSAGVPAIRIRFPPLVTSSTTKCTTQSQTNRRGKLHLNNVRRFGTSLGPERMFGAGPVCTGPASPFLNMPLRLDVKKKLHTRTERVKCVD
eukprot:284816163_3